MNAAPPSAPVRRVAFVLHAPDRSGIAYAALSLAEGLEHKGVRVLVLAAASGERADDYRRAGVALEIHPWMKWPLLRRAALESLRRFNPDLLHAQSVTIADVADGLAKKLEKPLVVTANRFDETSANLLAKLKLAGVAAVSDAVRERLAYQGGVSPSRIRVLPNGLDLGDFPRPDFDHPPPEHPLPVVGTFGELRELKGQRTFLAAAALLKARGLDAEYLLLGDGPDKAALRRMADDLGLGKRVTFSPQSRAGHLQMLDLLVEPSMQEGFGLSVLQAMATGIPVVASAVGGLFSLIEDGETGRLIPPKNPQALADAMAELLAQPETRHDMARRARDFVEEHFDIRKVVSETLQFYQDRCEAARLSAARR